MPSRELPCAASVLVAPVLDAAQVRLAESARTRVSVHYETGLPDLPVLCVCTPDAVRLPNSVLTPTLPARGLTAGAGVLRGHDGSLWRVTRWWRPPAPRGLPVPAAVPPAQFVARGCPEVPDAYLGLDPARLVGAGPGLTPAGDDVLAAALVTAHATGDPRLPDWRRRTRAALLRRTTTVVSRGMLHAALDGYAAPQLAACLEAVCGTGDPTSAVGDLLRVGHSSGVALWRGVTHTLTTRSRRRAA